MMPVSPVWRLRNCRRCCKKSMRKVSSHVRQCAFEVRQGTYSVLRLMAATIGKGLRKRNTPQ